LAEEETEGEGDGARVDEDDGVDDDSDGDVDVDEGVDDDNEGDVDVEAEADEEAEDEEAEALGGSRSSFRSTHVPGGIKSCRMLTNALGAFICENFSGGFGSLCSE